MSRSKQGGPEKGSNWAACTALALAALAVAGVGYLPSWAKWSVISGLLLLSAAFLIGGPRLRRIVKRVRFRLFFFWLHPDQARMAAEYPQYRYLISEQRKLLGFSLPDLAEKARISSLAIRFFEKFPDYIPRTDYLERLCDALLLPIGHLKKGGGGSYGYKYSSLRLLRYSEMPEFINVIRWDDIKAPTQEQLDEIVATVEALRREELRRNEGRVP